MKNLIGTLLALIAFGCMTSAFALSGESVVFNPTTGNYHITYQDSEDGSFQQVIFIPFTKINPTFRSKLKLDELVVHYNYTLISGRDSQQVITDIIFDPVSSIATDTPIPPVGTFSGDMTPVWMKSITNSAEAMIKAADKFDATAPWEGFMTNSMRGKTFRLGWGTKVAKGMPPGGRADFGFKSLDMPGIIQAEITGYAPGSEEIPGEQAQDPNDGGFGQQYTALISHNFVPRPAVPTIAVPSPFDAAVLLDRIQSQMHTWIGMKLLDPTFSGQLDRYLTAAAEAYRHSQPKAAKEDIERVREMLKKEHQDLGRDEEHENSKNREKNDDKKPAAIDRLAAKVLDFDLMYVQKRAGGDKGD